MLRYSAQALLEGSPVLRPVDEVSVGEVVTRPVHVHNVLRLIEEAPERPLHRLGQRPALHVDQQRARLHLQGAAAAPVRGGGGGCEAEEGRERVVGIGGFFMLDQQLAPELVAYLIAALAHLNRDRFAHLLALLTKDLRHVPRTPPQSPGLNPSYFHFFTFSTSHVKKYSK